MQAPSIDLPSRVYKAKTVRVSSVNSLLVDLDLGFGIHAHRTVYLEGVSVGSVPAPLRKNAMHCLVVLLGGKRLLLRTTDAQKVDGVLARVYLAEKVYGNPVGLSVPYGFDDALLDVSEFYLSLRTNGYDVSGVKSILNGVL